MADLVYNIATYTLKGIVGGVSFESRGYSGGRGGSKVDGVSVYFLANNVLSTHIKKIDGDNNSIGGTLPLGIYNMYIHEKELRWIRLLPSNDRAMHNRNGFAIHGSGSRGSDGCIVLTDSAILTRLVEQVMSVSGKCEKIDDVLILPKNTQLSTIEVVAIGTELDAKNPNKYV